jgi:hypothetical protein
MIVGVVGVACSLGVSSAYAGPGCCASKKKAQVAKASCTQKPSGDLGDFPTMLMKVGEMTYGCSATAEKAAAGNGSKVVFVVGEERFSNKNRAVVALASATEQYVERFTTIACLVDGKLVYCDEKSKAGCSAACGAKSRKASSSKSGCGTKVREATVAKAETEAEGFRKTKGKLVKADEASCGQKAKSAKSEGKTLSNKSECGSFFVIGREFSTHQAAVKARDDALSAVKKINMTYIVDGHQVYCGTQVSPEDKAAGKVQFVVEELKTGCEYDARVALAKAKYDAAKSTAGQVTKL